MQLHKLKNVERRTPGDKRVGRGVGSGKGKTCGRGTKGDKARSGYKRRLGNEGGQLPVFRKTPIRGFTRGRFLEDRFAINLAMVDKYFSENETVSLASLKEKRFISRKENPKVKILGEGDLSKSINFEVHGVSKNAEEKIKASKSNLKLVK